MIFTLDTLNNDLSLKEREPEYYNYLRSLLNLTLEEVLTQLAEGCIKYGKQYDEIDFDFDQLMIDEIKVRVHDVYQTKETFSRAKKETKLFNWLLRHVGDRKRVERIIDQYSIKESPVEFFTIGELLNSRNNDTGYIIKGLLPKGRLVIISAQAKSGKSVIGTNLVVKVALGEDFLNRPSIKGNVLFVQNEENIKNTTAERVRTGGLQTLELSDYSEYNDLINSHKIVICKNLDIVEHQDLLLEKVKKYDISLVVIDSLNGSIRQSGLTDTSPELGRALYNLQGLTHEHDFSIVLLHHNNKTSYNGGTKTQVEKIDAVAGRSFITRTNDGIWIVTRKEGKEGEKSYNELHIIPREGDPVTIHYSLIYGEACSWWLNVIKETVLTPENLQLQNAILRILFDKWQQWNDRFDEPDVSEEELYKLREERNSLPFGCTLDELVSITGIERELVIERTNDMKKSEGIICYVDHSIKKYIFSIPKTGETWLTHFLDKEDEAVERNKQKEEEMKLQQALVKRQAELVTEAVLANDVARYKEITNDWKTDLRVKVMELLTPEVKNLLWLLVRPPLFSISTSVTVEVENEYISTSVERVEYNTTDKYHMYYLVGFPDRTFRSEQLSKNEQTDGETSNEGDF